MVSGDDALAADPVRARRAQWARWAVTGTRVGYGLVLFAVVAFVVGFLTDFPSVTTTVVVICLLGTIVTLAPGIVIGYAVRAAEREDRELGR
ncbi:MAG: hypothetical protein ACRD0N_14355 [Acidimicrobiales bacterium]